MGYLFRISFVVLVGLFTFSLGPPLRAETQTYLTGQVMLNDEAFTQNASVSLYCYKNSSGYNYQSCWDWVSTDSTGSYALDNGGGSYDCCSSANSEVDWDSCQLYAYQWNNSSVTNSTEYSYVEPDCDTTLTQNFSFREKDRTIAVTVTAGSQNITEGVYVSCYQDQAPWTSCYTNESTNGVYNCSVTEGTYTCSTYCDWSFWQNSCPYDGYPTSTVTVADDTVFTSLNYSIKDKTIRMSVYAGSELVTEGVSVSCSKQTSPWTWGNDTSAGDDGTYAILVSEGYYYCSSYPYCSTWPCENELTGSPHVYVDVPGSASIVDAELTYQVKDKKIRTRIFAGSREITSGVSVSCYQQGGSYDYAYAYSPTSDGYYECSVGTGTYSVYAWCSDWQNCDFAGYAQGSVNFSADDPAGTVGDITLTFLDNNATLSGVVTDGSSGIPNVYVSINAHNISSDLGSAVSSRSVKGLEVTNGSADLTQVYLSAQTNSSGSFDKTAPSGTYSACVWPPYDRQDLAQTCQDVTITAGGTTSIILTMTEKTGRISGCVTDASGNGVPSYVNGWSNNGVTGQNDYIWKQTDDSGCYEAYAVEGSTYNMTVSPDKWNNQSSTFCSYTNEGMQVITATSGGQTVDFTVPTCDCALTVNVKDANDEIVQMNGSIDCKPAVFDSDEYYYGIYGYMSSGNGTLYVENGREYTCKVWSWYSDYIADSESDCTCSDNASACDIGASPVIEDAVTGNYIDGNGNSVTLSNTSYIYVYATKDKDYRSCTATNTDFSCDLSEGTWTLGYYVDPSSGYATSSAGTASNEVSVTSSGGVSFNLTLLNTATIACTVLNTDSSGRPNTGVECCPYSAAQEGANDYQYSYGCAWGNSNSEGVAELNVGATSSGVVYYCSAHIPYNIRRDEGTNNPEEDEVTAIAGETSDCTLQYNVPDGTATITVTEGNISIAALTKGKTPLLKTVRNADGDSSSSSVISQTTVDCFSSSGGFASADVTDESETVTVPITTGHTWYCVAHNLVGNALYVSEAIQITQSDSGEWSATCALDYVTTVPEAVSQTITDAATQSISLALSDTATVYFQPASLGDANESVTCTMSAVVTPFMPNRFVVNFYGYFVQCLDANGVAIQQLNLPATFTLPCSQTRLETTGLTENDIQCSYFDTSTGSYMGINTATVACENGITFSVDHLTDFAIVGNGYLGAIQGEDGGAIGKGDDVEESSGGDDAGDTPEGGSEASGGSASSGCGCTFQNSGGFQINAWLLFGMLIFARGWYGLRRSLKIKK